MRALALLTSVLLIPSCGKDGATDTSAGSGSASGTGTDSDGGGGTHGSGTHGTESGSGSGGASGASGAGSGTSQGGTETGGGACTSEEDCKLFNDCCECKAVPASEDPPGCDLACDQPTCESWGASAVACRDGACVIAPINCDDSMVECDGPTPQCPDGFRPVVSDDGSCWTGQCTPTELCG